MRKTETTFTHGVLGRCQLAREKHSARTRFGLGAFRRGVIGIFLFWRITWRGFLNWFFSGGGAVVAPIASTFSSGLLVTSSVPQRVAGRQQIVLPDRALLSGEGGGGGGGSTAWAFFVLRERRGQRCLFGVDFIIV